MLFNVYLSWADLEVRKKSLKELEVNYRTSLYTKVALLRNVVQYFWIRFFFSFTIQNLTHTTTNSHRVEETLKEMNVFPDFLN